MQWRKLGQIFDPRDVALPAGCIGYAQAPQALVFPKFVRIYYSTRAVDPTSGKFISHVAFVDFDHSLTTILAVAHREAIPLGGLGCFDEHGIFPMSVIRHEEVIYAYPSGWSRRQSVSVETAIGLAVSKNDGVSFSRVGPGPVLSASLHEPFLVGDGYVRVIEERFHMWYIFGTAWETYEGSSEPERTYKIGHAVSLDGRAWQKEEGRQIVADRLGPQESQALPTVVEYQGSFHMFFCYRESVDFRTRRGRGYRIGHAVSTDLLNWRRDDLTPILEGDAGAWDSDMQCYPNAVVVDGKVILLYNGNEFGRHGFGAAVLES